MDKLKKLNIQKLTIQIEAVTDPSYHLHFVKEGTSNCRNFKRVKFSEHGSLLQNIYEIGEYTCEIDLLYSSCTFFFIDLRERGLS